MKRKVMLILLIIVSITMTSCWDERIYERMGFILNVGIEADESGQLLISYTNPVVGIQQKGEVELITNEAHSLREAREAGRRISPKNLEGGKIQHILVAREIAELGVHNLIELFQRDPINPALAIVAVVEGSPTELLEKTLTFEDKPRSAFYLSQLLENNIKYGYIPETRIYSFDIAYFAPGIDPITPMIRLEPKGVRVIGSALFSDDKMVGSIDVNQTVLLLGLMNKFGTPSYVVDAKDLYEKEDVQVSHMSVLLRGLKRKIDLEIVNDRLIVNFYLKFDVTLDDFEWDFLDDEKNQKKVEEHLGRALEQDSIDVLKYTQVVGSDPIGIGDMVRAKYNSYWKTIDWKETYKKIEMNVDVTVEVMQYGSIK